MKEFNKEDLEFFLPNTWRGISKDYILDKVFDKEVQSGWIPTIGDIIVGCTGNIFIISGKHELIKELGGTVYFFGGGFCNRNGSSQMNETYCPTMNKDGLWYEFGKKPTKNVWHSSYKDFRFVPWPHEIATK